MRQDQGACSGRPRTALVADGREGLELGRIEAATESVIRGRDFVRSPSPRGHRRGLSSQAVDQLGQVDGTRATAIGFRWWVPEVAGQATAGNGIRLLGLAGPGHRGNCSGFPDAGRPFRESLVRGCGDAQDRRAGALDRRAGAGNGEHFRCAGRISRVGRIRILEGLCLDLPKPMADLARMRHGPS